MPSAGARSVKTPLATRRRPSDDLEELGEGLEVEVGVDVATAPTPPVTGPLSVVKVGSFVPMAFAAAKKAAPVFPVDGALIVPTIPRPQCCDSLQKK